MTHGLKNQFYITDQQTQLNMCVGIWNNSYPTAANNSVFYSTPFFLFAVGYYLLNSSGHLLKNSEPEILSCLKIKYMENERHSFSLGGVICIFLNLLAGLIYKSSALLCILPYSFMLSASSHIYSYWVKKKGPKLWQEMLLISRTQNEAASNCTCLLCFLTHHSRHEVFRGHPT